MYKSGESIHLLLHLRAQVLPEEEFAVAIGAQLVISVVDMQMV